MKSKKPDEVLVEAAQSGDSDACLIMLERYDGYINTYYGLLRYGRVDLKNKDQRRFLQLYIKDSVLRKGLVNRHQPKESRHEAYRTATYLQRQCEQIDKEDLKQDLKMLFIECVMRYEHSNRLFISYVKNYYRFRVEWYLRRVFKYDWLNHPNKNLIGYEVNQLSDDAVDVDVREEWFDRFLANALRRDRLDLFWINGRCSALFKDLTVFERTILRDRYHLKLTDGEIAKQYGYHINSIWKKRQKAIDKLDKKRRESL